MSKPVIAITRPIDRAQKACEIVENLGGEAFLAPTLDLKPVNTDSLKERVARKDELDWIVFTSPTTIVSLNKFYPGFIEGLDCKLAVIGNKTGKLAEKQGVKVDLMPDDFTAEGLVAEFEKQGIDLGFSEEEKLNVLNKLEKLDLSCQPEKLNNRPLFFWHGEKDSVVPITGSRAFVKELEGKVESGLITYISDKTAGHAVTRKGLLEAVNWTEDKLV